jgi:flagellin-like hook-associated protein FlgL
MLIRSRLSGVDLVAQHNLIRALARLHQCNARLSTMRRINRGSDDPAALIAAEQLQSGLTAIKTVGESAARAAGVVRVADAAMSQVGSLLNSIRANVVAAAGGNLSETEVNARQLEVDAALEAIDRIGSSTSFGGRQLLDGSRLTFNLSPDLDQPVTLTLPTVHTSALGGESGPLCDLATGRSASLTSDNLGRAVDILDAAQDEILEARARAGALEKYTIDCAARVLGSMEVNISSAMSMIRDTDVALEMSRRVQAEIMVHAAVSALLLAGQHGWFSAFG